MTVSAQHVDEHVESSTGRESARAADAKRPNTERVRAEGIPCSVGVQELEGTSGSRRQKSDSEEALSHGRVV